MFEHTIRAGNKLLRCGYTTGTCAALAASGAAEYLLSGVCPGQVSVTTAKGIPVEVSVESAERTARGVRVGVRKFAGDDPDVTDGVVVCAEVAENAAEEILIDGGEGVGRVTRPGLDQPVGAAAINSAPRRMIREAVAAVCGEHGYTGGLSVRITVPGGEEIARKTFNPAIGVVGGISILGTTGIEEPMSERALIDVIEVEIRQAAQESGELVLTPGNYGEEYLKREQLLFPGIPVVKYSGYLGEALDAAAVAGMKRVLIVSHVGKLVKTAGGIMNTHQRVADCRAELFCAHAAVAGADRALCGRLMDAATTDACLVLLAEAGLKETVCASLLEAIGQHLARRVDGAYNVGAIMFSNVCGTLGMTGDAAAILASWRGRG